MAVAGLDPVAQVTRATQAGHEWEPQCRNRRRNSRRPRRHRRRHRSPRKWDSRSGWYADGNPGRHDLGDRWRVTTEVGRHLGRGRIAVGWIGRHGPPDHRNELPVGVGP